MHKLATKDDCQINIIREIQAKKMKMKKEITGNQQNKQNNVSKDS